MDKEIAIKSIEEEFEKNFNIEKGKWWRKGIKDPVMLTTIIEYNKDLKSFYKAKFNNLIQ